MAMSKKRTRSRIHLFDLVTSSEHLMVNRIFTVVGALRVGKLKGLEGLWLLKDFKTNENVECPGCFITVWKPVSHPRKSKKLAHGNIDS